MSLKKKWKDWCAISSPSYLYLYDNFWNQYSVKLQQGDMVENVTLISEEVDPNAKYMSATIGVEEFKKIIPVRNIPIIK